jgi:hypothetical protein
MSYEASQVLLAAMMTGEAAGGDGRAAATCSKKLRTALMSFERMGTQ